MVSAQKVTRRAFLKFGVAAGAGLWLTRLDFAPPAHAYAPAAQMLPPGAPLPGGSLDPVSIPKYKTRLVVPPAMPRTDKVVGKMANMLDYYEIAVRQFQQQILPPQPPAGGTTPLGPTTVWSYCSVNHPGTLNYPAFTIEAKVNRPVRVKWINGLVDGNGNHLPHLLPVDPTLHWANPPGGTEGRDMRPAFAQTPERYTGPVPIVTHVHGAHVAEHSDGYAEAWFLPAAGDIPADYATVGSKYDQFKGEAEAVVGTGTWQTGSAVFQYSNDQRASTLWYHDHSLGMTRLNVYAGPAGFYNLRGGTSDLSMGILPGPAPALGDLPGTKYYEIPIAIQDRSFNADGSLFYPEGREYFDGFTGPYVPDSDMSPIWNPEFFGNTMVVNGRTWPFLEVEPRRYRFRFLNGCQARYLLLQFDSNLPFWQIGSEGGFLPAPVQLPQLLMSPAERADVIVDFTGLPVGTTITLLNLGPDEPFNGDPFAPANPDTTGQVMQFRVIKKASVDKSVPPAQLVLPPLVPLGAAVMTRQVSLNELDSEVLPEVGPLEARLGTVDFSTGAPGGVALRWMDAVTENVALGATEVWEIYNFTGDAHPIHIHQTQFQVVEREALGGVRIPPNPWETGYKDTVTAYPNQITRVKAKFDLPGLFVWHCHIVEHEDNEMMRPFIVG